MTNSVLKTTMLSKAYSAGLAVDDVNINIQRGDIYGFIGQNGAGKTTLIRIVTGLISATKGEVALFGDSSAESLEKSRKRIGCMVEAPAFMPKMTARQNLEYYRIQRGIPDEKAIDKALETVNLTETGKKKYHQFSLGMKQRLGLALAIMGKPDFLILDEPINGLDPMGIIEFREVIKDLVQKTGMTVLVSSHILSELAQVANKFGIIHGGRLIREITAEQLQEETKQSLALRVQDTSLAVTVLEQNLGITKYEVLPGNEIRIYEKIDNPSEITFQLSTNQVRVESMSQKGTTLEEFFLETIGYESAGRKS